MAIEFYVTVVRFAFIYVGGNWEKNLKVTPLHFIITQFHLGV